MIDDKGMLEDAIDILIEKKTCMERFHISYVLNTSLSAEEENERSSIIDTLESKFLGLLGERKTIQLVLNLHHLCSCILDVKNVFLVDGEQSLHVLFVSLFIICKIERPNHLIFLKDEAVKSNINLEVIYRLESFILNKLGWKLNLETPQVLSIELLNLITMKFGLSDQIEVLNQLSFEFNQIFSFIHTEYNIYKQFNSFIWTVVILQFILIKNRLTDYSCTLNFLIDLTMREAQCDDLPQLIKCFDLINSLYENSLSENESESRPNDLILQTPICRRMEDLDLYLTDEKEIKEFMNNNTNFNLESKSLEFRFMSEELNQKEEIEASYKSIEDITQTSNDLCMHITCDGDPDHDDCSQKKYSRVSLPVQPRTFLKSLGSCKTTNLEGEAEIDTEPTVNLSCTSKENIETRQSSSEQDYCSRHQSFSIIKLLKKNSTKKLVVPRRVSENNSFDEDSFSEKQASERQIHCRRAIKKSKRDEKK